MLARIIFQSKGMVNYWVGKDDELDAALILSGRMQHTVQAGRYCFQTTYVNECYEEYYAHAGHFKMIWVLRNPYSTVHSLLHNWKRFAFNELFDASGVRLLDNREKERYELFGRLALSRLRRACLSYNGKTFQMFDLMEQLGRNHIFVADYDQLVTDVQRVLSAIYEFIDLPYETSYARSVSERSLGKAKRLKKRERAAIERLCMPVYERARSLLTPV